MRIARVPWRRSPVSERIVPLARLWDRVDTRARTCKTTSPEIGSDCSYQRRGPTSATPDGRQASAAFGATGVGRPPVLSAGGDEAAAVEEGEDVRENIGRPHDERVGAVDDHQLAHPLELRAGDGHLAVALIAEHARE